MWYQLTTSSAIAQTDLDTWLSTLAGFWKSVLQTHLPGDYTFNYAKAVCFTPGGGELVSTYTPTAWSGTNGTTTPVGSLSAVLSWTTSVYWRGGKPRSYVPLGSSHINSGLDTIVSTQRTALAADGVTLKNDWNGMTQGTITGTVFGFVSFRTGNAERGTPLFFAKTGCIVHPRCGTQRRRDGKWQN
jgi:hypothetical protein